MGDETLAGCRSGCRFGCYSDGRQGLVPGGPVVCAPLLCELGAGVFIWSSSMALLLYCSVFMALADGA